MRKVTKISLKKRQFLEDGAISTTLSLQDNVGFVTGQKMASEGMTLGKMVV
jgi:hypothetical protein